MTSNSLFWADQLADEVIKAHKTKTYVVECGITPSGRKHIGNYREIITNALVAKALEEKGKKVIFQLGWDDYDRLRSLPEDIENREFLKKQIGKPVSDVAYKGSTYANYFEKILFNEIKDTGINPKQIHNYKYYTSGKFAPLIRTLMRKRKLVAEILNRSRREPYPANWYPLTVYCESCNTDSTQITSYDENYELTYDCNCGNKATIDFSKKHIVKPPYRVDWAMRWAYFKVNSESAGKDHMVKDSSFDRSSDIVREVFNKVPPIGTMYDFVRLKGHGGKMSASKGNVLTVEDVLKIYFAEILRYQFASTKPNKEFVIPLDEEIIKTYDDFYKAERIYFGKEKVTKRDKAHWSRVYEMSCVNKPSKTMPIQPNFTHCVELVNIFAGDTKKALKKAIELDKLTKKQDIDRYASTLLCAKNWLAKYAPEKYKFELRSPKKINLTKEQRETLKLLASTLEKKRHTEQTLSNEFYNIKGQTGISTGNFFKAAYLALVGKERGPRLAPFILAIGQKKAANLFNKA
tara:strand:+ start:93 stop:1652 length:1560 start_codon:yes stop_codon:yes gene_type:complete